LFLESHPSSNCAIASRRKLQLIIGAALLVGKSGRRDVGKRFPPSLFFVPDVVVVVVFISRCSFVSLPVT
jgi:hypothetical protein